MKLLLRKMIINCIKCGSSLIGKDGRHSSKCPQCKADLIECADSNHDCDRCEYGTNAKHNPEQDQWKCPGNGNRIVLMDIIK